MIKAATLSLGLFIVLGVAGVSNAQVTPEQTAINEGIRRQASILTLRETLNAAQDAESRRDLPTAARLYDDAWALVQSIGAGVDQERDLARTGLARVRLEQAQGARRRGNLLEAKERLDD